MVYCIIYGEGIHQKAFLNWFCQYLSSLNIFLNRFCLVEKSGVTPDGLYRDSITLMLHVTVWYNHEK